MAGWSKLYYIQENRDKEKQEHPIQWKILHIYNYKAKNNYLMFLLFKLKKIYKLFIHTENLQMLEKLLLKILHCVNAYILKKVYY